MDFSQNQLGYFPQMPVCDKRMTVELNSDFSLPDYNSEIRRLLLCRAYVKPESEYIGNSNAEIRGEVLYRVLYLGADGKLYSADMSDNYSLSVPLDFSSYCVNHSELTLHTICDKESVTTRVLGPRKLNLKAKLTCRVLALSPHLLTPSSSGSFRDASVEDLVLSTNSVYMKKCVGEAQMLNDFIPLDTEADNVRIIDYHTSVHVDECTPSNDRVTVSGEVLLKLLYCNDLDSEEVLCTTRRIPFTETVYCEGVSNAYECSARGFISSEKLEIDENGIKIELPLNLSVTALTNITVPYVTDSFSTENLSEAKNKTAKTRVGVRNANGCLTQNAVFTLDEARLKSGCKIIDVHGNAKCEEASLENGRIRLKGVTNYSVVYVLEGEYGTCELASPFKFELDARTHGEAPEIICDATASISSIKARVDAERLFIDAELCFCILAQRDEEISYLSEITFTDAREKNSDGILLCYPEKNATVWSLAKRYGESLKALRERNAIPEEDTVINKKYVVL